MSPSPSKRIRSRSASPGSIAIRDGFRQRDAMSPSTSTSAMELEALPRNAATHFKLCFLGAVLHVAHQLSNNLGSRDELLEQFPFMRTYLEEIEKLGGGEATAAEWLA